MRSLGVVLGGAALTFFAAVPAIASGGGPNAIDDSFVAEKKVAHVDVLANDSPGDASLDFATLRIASSPSQGEAVVIASGSPKVKYTAPGSEAIIDNFSYEVCDTAGACATATVMINFLGEILTTSTTISPITTSPPPPALPVVPATATTVTVKSVETTTTAAAKTTSPSLVSAPPRTTTAPAPKVHAPADLALGSNAGEAVGTTLGEARGVNLGEDVAYLGRSGLDTLALVATPALMVSGVVGFLMIGLPQNAFGLLFGLVVGRRRKEEKGPKSNAATTRGAA